MDGKDPCITSRCTERQKRRGPVVFAGYLVCLRVKLVVRRAGVVSWNGAKEREKNVMCGARWIWLLWMSCSEALHRRKETREAADMTAKETISGSLLTRAYHTMGATRLGELSGSSRGPGTRYAMRRPRRSGLRGWAARSHTGRAVHQGDASCRKQR